MARRRTRRSRRSAGRKLAAAARHCKGRTKGKFKKCMRAYFRRGKRR